MKTHTSSFKNEIKKLGKQLDSKITYELEGETIELGAEELNSISPHFEAQILKSAMKQLDVDSNVEIPVGTEINYQFGVLVNDSFEYLDFGNYIVKNVEKQEDTRSYKITCYDKLLYSMKPYEKMNITYPITIRNYINAICNHLGLTFANASDTFANYNKQIEHELYLSYNEEQHDYVDDMGYTFRDVLDELAQVTGSTICINSDDELEIRYINDTEDTIDEEYLKDINVNFGEKYGPVNAIVLSRAGGSDRVYLRDNESIAENGLCEINISENQIMNFNDRSTYLPDLLSALDGLEYYLNDFSSPGITYYDICDKYNVNIGENTYNCIMFNDEINVTQGLEENVNTEMPEQSETDYTKADKTDRKINQTYIIVDKQNQKIESVVSNVTEQNEKISTIEQTVDQIQSQITDIPTITTENSGTGSVYLSNLANTKLILLRIHPTDRDILGLFASHLLKASTTLKSLSRGVTFDNTNGTESDLYYKLPDNLYYYDSETYDEFVYDGKEEKIYVIRKVAVDEQGNKSILDTPVTEEYEYQDLIIESGDYNVFMSTYPTAYIYVKAMIKNDYTDLFATSYEVDSKITQTADTINLEVSNKVDNEDYNGANIMLKINSDESQAQIRADKINLQGYVTASDLAGTGTTVINGSNITTGTITGQTINGGTINGTDITASNSLYVGTNQSSSTEDIKYIKMSDLSYLQRIKYQGYDNLIIDSTGIKINAGIQGDTAGRGTVFYSDGYYTEIHNYFGNGQYIILDSGYIHSSSDIIPDSDERLKQNIEDLDISFIDDLKVKKYQYKNSPNFEQIGLIAQDYIEKDYSKYFVVKHSNGFYGINYNNINSALIQYCQELKKEINSLKEEIKELKESDK